MALKNIKTIKSYKAFVYSNKDKLEIFLKVIKKYGFDLTFCDILQKKKPHALNFIEIAFLPNEFFLIVPWLMLNAEGLSVAIVPVTGKDKPVKDDFLRKTLWLGPKIPFEF